MPLALTVFAGVLGTQTLDCTGLSLAYRAAPVVFAAVSLPLRPPH